MLQDGSATRGLADAGRTNVERQTSNVILYIFDRMGNVRHKVLVGDGSPAVTASYEYDPYGRLLYAEPPPTYETAPQFLFSTKLYESHWQHYYYGYRYYSPDLGRWLSRDPIGEADGPNVYATCMNALMRCYDSLGLSSQESAKCNKCGVEIAEQLEATLQVVALRFAALAPEEKARRCSKLHLRRVWDINMYSAERRDCGSKGECKGSMMVKGRCYSKWTVNYILFGKISNLCKMWDLTMEALIFAHKTFVKPVEQRRAGKEVSYEYTEDVRGFARLGRSMGVRIDNVPVPTGKQKECQPCDTSLPLPPAPFGTTWP